MCHIIICSTILCSRWTARNRPADANVRIPGHSLGLGSYILYKRYTRSNLVHSVLDIRFRFTWNIQAYIGWGGAIYSDFLRESRWAKGKTKALNKLMQPSDCYFTGLGVIPAYIRSIFTATIIMLWNVGWDLPLLRCSRSVALVWT